MKKILEGKREVEKRDIFLPFVSFLEQKDRRTMEIIRVHQQRAKQDEPVHLKNMVDDFFFNIFLFDTILFSF